MNAHAIGQTERAVVTSEAAAASSDDRHAAERRTYHNVQNGIVHAVLTSDLLLT